MKLEDLLARCPGSLTEHLAAACGLQEARKGIGNFKRDLARTLTSGAYLERQWSFLKDWERETVRVCIRSFAFLPFDRDMLEARAKGLSGAHLHAALLRLRRKGILYALKKTWGEEVCVLPEEALPVWHRILFPDGEVQEGFGSGDWPEEYGAGNQGGLAEDLLQAAVFAAKHQPALTRKGTLPKPVLKKLESRFGIRDEEVASAGARCRFEGDYGPYAATVLDMGIQLGMLQMQEGKLTVNRDGLSRFLRTPREQLQGMLYRLWIRRIRAERAAELHALAKLEQLEAGRCHILGNLFEWLVRYGMIDKITREELDEFRDRLLLPMQALGWIRLHRLPDQGVFFRLTVPLSEEMPHGKDWNRSSPRPEPEPSGNRYPGLIVQNDFDIVVPPEPPFAVLWELEAVAERISSDGVSVYRLTPDTVRFALENGRSGEDITDFLESHAAYPLPVYVKETLRQWGARYTSVMLEPVTLLRCRDRETAALVEGHLRSKSCLGEKVGDTSFLILSGQAQALILELERLGLHPGKGFDGTEDNPGYPSALSIPVRECEHASFPGSGETAAESAPDTADAGLLVPYVTDPVYAPAHLPSEPDRGEWRSVPSMWWKECRPYHASTQKEMIRKAIEWKTGLRLKDGREEWELVPMELRDTGETWSVEGWKDRERVTAQAGDWLEMQMILPGINDDS